LTADPFADIDWLSDAKTSTLTTANTDPPGFSSWGGFDAVTPAPRSKTATPSNATNTGTPPRTNGISTGSITGAITGATTFSDSWSTAFSGTSTTTPAGGSGAGAPVSASSWASFDSKGGCMYA